MVPPIPGDPDDPNGLATFLSATQRSLLARVTDSGGLTTVTSQGAALFVDVVGFSQLAGRFAADGPRGAEMLSQLIDSFFGRMTDLILESGGDLLVYAGDAVLAIWPADPAELSEAVARAAGCAQVIQRVVAASTTADSLRLRAAVGAGSIDAHQVGGHGGAWLFHATGTAIRTATLANAHCPVGRTALTRPAWHAIDDRATGTPIEADLWLLESLESPAPGEPWADHGAAAAPAVIAKAVPRVVVDRIGARFGAWLGEFRTVSVGFVNLSPPSTGTAGAAIEVQPAVVAIQEVLQRYGGQTYQLVTDDKGTTMIVAFGLPPEAHEDDPHRAVLAALAIGDRLRELDPHAGIGLTTAVVYAGLYGRAARRQYSIVGPSVNLAARLMQSAESAILCDEETARTAGGRAGDVCFENLGTRSFKGLAAPIPVFRAARALSATPRDRGAEVIGRVGERSALAAAVRQHGEGLATGCWVVLGEAGMGKSRLLGEAEETARARGTTVLRAAGDPIEVGTPYFAWRGVFRSIVDQRSADEPWPAEWSLLGPVLGRSVAESAELAGVSDEVKAERRQRLVVTLLADAASRARILISVEDVHWLDPSSLDVLTRLAESAAGPLIVATSRPADTNPSIARLVAIPGVSQITLGGLSGEDTRALVARTLAVDTVADPLVALIEGKAAGNPLFIEQLALVLKDFGLAWIRGAAASLDETRGDPTRVLDQLLGSMGVPATVQGLITSRVDRLGVDDQLVVKVASAIGRSFDLPTLAAACPPELGPARLAAALNSLATQRLIDPDRSADSEDGYLFGHAITQDVVYSGLSFVQRGEVHGRVARWYQRSHGDSPVWYPRLAHHWAAAGDGGQAARYYRLAGSDALRAYANAAAAGFLSEAARLEDAAPVALGPLGSEARASRAALELMLGRAYRGLSRYDLDQPHLERGVGLLGFRVPRRAAGMVVGVLTEAGRQVVHSLARSRVLGSRSRDRGRLLEVAAAYEGLAESYFYTGRQLATLYACLRSLNLAERAGPSPELARGYASVGAVAGQLTLRGVSTRYGDRAVATARAVDSAGALPWVSVLVALTRASEGDWDHAAPLFREAESVAGSVGDWRRWADAVGHLALQAAWAGRSDEALGRFQDVVDAARRAKDPRYEAGALPMRARLLLQLGRENDAIQDLRRLGELLAVGLKAEAAASEADQRALDALVQARAGAWNVGFEQARLAADLATRVVPAGALYNGFLAMVDLGEVATLAIEARRPEGLPLLDRICPALRAYARVHRVAAPAWLRLDGVRRWARGDQTGAARRLRRAAATARRHGMEIEAALAELELGRHVLRDSAERDALIARTEATLGRAGLGFHQRRAAATTEAR